jgi:hypothetical protein
MQTKHSDKIVVGAAWASFDDGKASWGLNRHIAARCGQTFSDTSNMWRKYFPSDDLLPFVMIETWNDREEGTAIEDGIPNCGPGSQKHPLTEKAAGTEGKQRRRFGRLARPLYRIEFRFIAEENRDPNRPPIWNGELFGKFRASSGQYRRMPRNSTPLRLLCGSDRFLQVARP